MISTVPADSAGDVTTTCVAVSLTIVPATEPKLTVEASRFVPLIVTVVPGAPAAGCVFNDVTTDTIAMPCVKGTANCTVTNSSDRYGVLSGYSSTVGYDLATGLGSVNAANIAAPAAKIDQRMMPCPWVLVCLMSASLVSRSPSDLVAVIVYQRRNTTASARFAAMVTHFTTSGPIVVCDLR